MGSLLQQGFRSVYDSTVAKIPGKVSFSSHVHFRVDSGFSSSGIFKFCKDSTFKLKTTKHFWHLQKKLSAIQQKIT